MGILALWVACALGCAIVSDQPSDDGFAGVGQGNVKPIKTTLLGEILYKNYTGGEIIVEVRESFPCAYGYCPVIERPPLAQERLAGPGSYALPLSEGGENLIIIATYMAGTSGIRIAHRTVTPEGVTVTGLDLSLDRPYAPLR